MLAAARAPGVWTPFFCEGSSSSSSRSWPVWQKYGCCCGMSVHWWLLKQGRGEWSAARRMAVTMAYDCSSHTSSAVALLSSCAGAVTYYQVIRRLKGFIWTG